LKTSELRALPTPELEVRLDEIREELFNLRFQNATGQLENYKRLGFMRKDVARIATILHERLLGIEQETAPEEKPRRRRRRRDESTDADTIEGEGASPTEEDEEDEEVPPLAETKEGENAPVAEDDEDMAQDRASKAGEEE
jgi:large subunit ribosomal protein L29